MGVVDDEKLHPGHLQAAQTQCLHRPGRSAWRRRAEELAHGAAERGLVPVVDDLDAQDALLDRVPARIGKRRIRIGLQHPCLPRPAVAEQAADFADVGVSALDGHVEALDVLTDFEELGIGK